MILVLIFNIGGSIISPYMYTCTVALTGGGINQKSENLTLCPGLSMENVGISLNRPLDIWGGRGCGIFSAWFFFRAKNFAGYFFFTNMSLHDFFPMVSDSHFVIFLVWWHGINYFLMMGLGSSAWFVFVTGIHLLWNLYSNFFWYLPNPPPPSNI